MVVGRKEPQEMVTKSRFAVPVPRSTGRSDG